MPLIEVGSAGDFADSLLIRAMKDYRKMSRAELLAWIGKLRSKHARSAKTQKRRAAAVLAERAERLRAILDTAVEGIKTIEVHRANIKQKLQLSAATELVRYAVRWLDSQGRNDG
jgi:DNA-binding NarL/FixJ family response regulator